MKYTDLKTKKDKQAYIRRMCATNSRWALKGLVRIFENQTADEQSIGATIEHNNIGFSGCDSEILSSFAKQVIDGRTLSVKQMNIVFRKMPRYSRQLMEASS